MIYLFEAEEGTLSSEESFLLYNSILAAVAEANKDVVILESPDTAVRGPRRARRSWRAASRRTAALRHGERRFQNLTVEASTFDILRQTERAGTSSGRDSS